MCQEYESNFKRFYWLSLIKITTTALNYFYSIFEFYGQTHSTKHSSSSPICNLPAIHTRKYQKSETYSCSFSKQIEKTILVVGCCGCSGVGVKKSKHFPSSKSSYSNSYSYLYKCILTKFIARLHGTRKMACYVIIPGVNVILTFHQSILCHSSLLPRIVIWTYINIKRKQCRMIAREKKEEVEDVKVRWIQMIIQLSPKYHHHNHRHREKPE